MLAQPSVIKRPVLERDGKYHLGFADEQYQALFGA
jgi:arsenate reductase